MIRALALLLVCQLAGEVLARVVGLAVPGPVVGLALLVLLAVVHARIVGAETSAIEKTDLGVTASALLGSLGLLFVPAGVGIVQQLPLIGAYALRDFCRAAGLDRADTAGHGVCLHLRQARDGAERRGGRRTMSNPFSIWVYLSATPLLWLALTLVAWIAADAIARACGRHPLVNPVLIAIVVIGGILVATGTPYETYFEGAQFVHFLLGPATVAIAVPLVRHLRVGARQYRADACRAGGRRGDGSGVGRCGGSGARRAARNSGVAGAEIGDGRHRDGDQRRTWAASRRSPRFW